MVNVAFCTVEACWDCVGLLKIDPGVEWAEVAFDFTEEKHVACFVPKRGYKTDVTKWVLNYAYEYDRSDLRPVIQLHYLFGEKKIH